MKTKIALFFTLAICSLCTVAQPKLTFDKVNKVFIRSSGPILQGSEIKGYFFFFETDKIDKKTRQYTLNITDEFLNVVKEVPIVDDKNVSLLESSFDGESLIFLFYNKAEQLLNYRIYGLDGKEKMNYSKDLDKRDRQMIENALTMTKEGTESQFVSPLESKGFISLIPIRDGKDYSWEMNFYSSASKKQWTYAPEEDHKVSFASYLGNTDSMAIMEVLQRDKLLSKTNESHLLGINLLNGRKLFDILLEQNGYNLLPMNALALKGRNEFLVFGQYYNGDDRVGADPSQGIFLMTVDAKGKTLNKKYLSWANELSRFVNVNSKGKVEDIGFLFCHKIVPLEDGGFAIVAEGYKKGVSALGIAAYILTQSYSNSVTKIVITDMVLIQVKSNFTIESFKTFEKNKNNIEFPGSDLNSTASVAQYIKAFGGFDYSFTQKDPVNGGFTVGYVDYERTSENKGLVFNSISCYNKKITTDKIQLTTKGARTYVYPAKPGNIMIMDYNKKEKKLDMRFEKLN